MFWTFAATLVPLRNAWRDLRVIFLTNDFEYSLLWFSSHGPNLCSAKCSKRKIKKRTAHQLQHTGRLPYYKRNVSILQCMAAAADFGPSSPPPLCSHVVYFNYSSVWAESYIEATRSIACNGEVTKFLTLLLFVIGAESNQIHIKTCSCLTSTDAF